MFISPNLAELTYPDWSVARLRLQDELGAITTTKSEQTFLNEYLRLSSEKTRGHWCNPHVETECARHAT